MSSRAVNTLQFVHYTRYSTDKGIGECERAHRVLQRLLVFPTKGDQVQVFQYAHCYVSVQPPRTHYSQQ